LLPKTLSFCRIAHPHVVTDLAGKCFDTGAKLLGLSQQAAVLPIECRRALDLFGRDSLTGQGGFGRFEVQAQPVYVDHRTTLPRGDGRQLCCAGA